MGLPVTSRRLNGIVFSWMQKASSVFTPALKQQDVTLAGNGFVDDQPADKYGKILELSKHTVLLLLLTFTSTER